MEITGATKLLARGLAAASMLVLGLSWKLEAQAV